VGEGKKRRGARRRLRAEGEISTLKIKILAVKISRKGEKRRSRKTERKRD